MKNKRKSGQGRDRRRQTHEELFQEAPKLITQALSLEGVRAVQGVEVAEAADLTIPVDPTEVQVPVEESQVEGAVALTEDDLPGQLAKVLDQLQKSEQARRQAETQLETSRTVNGSQGVRLAEMSDQLRAIREQLADAEARLKATNADSLRKEIARLNGELKQLTADLAQNKLGAKLTNETERSYLQEIQRLGDHVDALTEQLDEVELDAAEALADADYLDNELFKLDPDRFEEEPDGRLASWWYNVRHLDVVGPYFHNAHQLGRAAWRHKLWTLILAYIGAGVVLCKVAWLAWLFPGHIWLGNVLANLLVDADNNLLLMVLGGGTILIYLAGHLQGKFRGGFFSWDDKFISGVDFVELQIVRFFRWVWAGFQTWNEQRKIANAAIKAAKDAKNQVAPVVEAQPAVSNGSRLRGRGIRVVNVAQGNETNTPQPPTAPKTEEAAPKA